MTQIWKFLGREIGTVEGWDEGSGVESFCLYDFTPAPKIDLPKTDCLWIMVTQGRFVTDDDDGKETFSADILTTLSQIPRAD